MAKQTLNTTGDDLYTRVINAIKSDPEALVRAGKTDQLAALKLVIPERIRSLKYARRETFRNLETVKEEIGKKELGIALAVKEAKDDVTTKPLFTNTTTRQSEELRRRENDPSYATLQRERRKLYSIIYGYDEDIEYHERIDQSLVEIIAMTTASIEYEGKYGNTTQSNGSNGRSALRAKGRASQRRTELARSSGEESSGPTQEDLATS